MTCNHIQANVDATGEAAKRCLANGPVKFNVVGNVY